MFLMFTTTAFVLNLWVSGQHMSTLFLLKWILLNTCDCVPMTCLCACHCILNCICVLKRRNTMWLGSITCMTSQIVWYNYNEQDSKKGKLMHSVSACPCLSETLCAHAFCMWLHCFDMLLSPSLQMKTASSSSWGGSPTSFF